MYSPTTATIRLTLHVIAATIWVGGQITLAALLPVLRQHEGAARQAARAFNKVAWPAFAVLVITGMWNLVDIDATAQSKGYQVTVFVKIAVAVVAAVAEGRDSELHPTRGLGVDPGLGIDHPRNGLGADTGDLRDIFQGGRRAG